MPTGPKGEKRPRSAALRPSGMTSRPINRISYHANLMVVIVPGVMLNSLRV